MNWLQISHSFLAFLCTLVIYIILLIIVYGNSQKVAASYSSDAGDKPGSNTFVWNVVVDYGSMAISTIGIHIFAAFRMIGFFRKLRSSLDQTEKYLSKTMSDLEQQHHFSKYRKLSFVCIAYILTAVWLTLNWIQLYTYHTPRFNNWIIFTGSALVNSHSNRIV